MNFSDDRLVLILVILAMAGLGFGFLSKIFAIVGMVFATAAVFILVARLLKIV